MQRHRWHLVRALHVLLACIALWLPASAAAPARFAAEPAALVVTTASVVAVAQRPTQGRPETRNQVSVAACERIAPRAPAPRPALPAAGAPVDAASDAPSDALYLLNCALLC